MANNEPLKVPEKLSPISKPKEKAALEAFVRRLPRVDQRFASQVLGEVGCMKGQSDATLETINILE